MNILMVTACHTDPNSGAAGTEYQTAQALRGIGHEVETIWAECLPRHIRHGNLYYLAELPWSMRNVVSDRCRASRYDVIHVNQPYAWLAAREHKRLGHRGVFINRSHGWEPRIAKALAPWRNEFGVPAWRFPRGVVGRPMQTLLHQYARWAAVHADGMIVSCSEDRDYIIGEYGAAPERVALIPQAPPASFVDAAIAPMTASRVERILYVGQSGFFKGPHVMAAVFSRLAAHRPSLQFTWCTAAADHAACRDLLSPAARPRVTFLDWMPQQKLLGLYEHHGIFVFTTLAEGFGKVFLEAMSRGLCVVASNTAGMRDVIHDGESGCLVPVGSVDAFCQSVEQLQADLCSAQQMSSAAVAAARAHTWTRVANETAAFYGQVHDLKKDVR